MGSESILKNYLLNATYSLLNIIIPIITIPYVSRILLADGVGKVSFAQNIVSYFVLIASLGIPNYGIREVAKSANDILQRSKVFWEIFLINCISTTIAVIAYYTTILTVGYFGDKRILLIVVGLSLVLNICNIDWFYKGIEDFKYITIRSYIIKILSLIAILIFVRSPNDIVIYAFIVTATTSTNYILNIIHVRKFINPYPIRKLELKSHLKPIFFMFATALAVELYAQLDTTMVGVLCGDTYVGYYSNSMKLIKILVVVITAIGTVLLPRISQYIQTGRKEDVSNLLKKAVEYILFISLPATLGLFMVSNDIVKLFFGSDFLPAITTMKILVFLVPIISVGNIFGSQLLIALNQEKLLTLTVFLGAIVNLLLNSFLIIGCKQNGAAVASVIAELCVMCSQIILSRRFIKIDIDKTNIVKTIVQCIVMIGSVCMVRVLFGAGIVRLIAEMIVGGLCFIITGLIIKNRFELDIFEKISMEIKRR